MSLMRMFTWAQQSLLSLKLVFTVMILAAASIGFAILRGKHAAQSHYWRKRAEARLHTMIKKLRTATVMLCVAGCAQMPSLETNPCLWASPIRPSDEDQLADRTTEQILVHNEMGEQFCGWRP